MMRFWGRLRDRTLDDFADAIRPELGEMRTPAAGDALLERIQASRGAGTRIILPQDDVRVRSPVPRYFATLIAATVALVVGSMLFSRRAGEEDIASIPSWFVSAAYGQTPPDAFEPVRISMSSRVRPMSLTYTRRVDGEPNTVIDLRVQREPIRGIPAWRMTSTRRSDASLTQDTVFIAASDLRPLRIIVNETPYRAYASIRLSQTFEGLRVFGDVDARRTSGPDAHRTFDRQLPLEAAPYTTDAAAPIYLMGVPLSSGWKGRVSLLGWAVRDDDIAMSMNMRVEGDERVRVPAGEFDCWRLAIDVGGARQYYWVRKSDGLGVKSHADNPVREIVLQRES